MYARAVRGFPVDLHRADNEGLAEPCYVCVRRETRSQLTVPLASPRGVLGAISLESDRTDAFTSDDVSLTSLFAQQATIVIERALLHEERVHQSRLDREIEIAREILQSLTPSTPPELLGLDIAGRSLSAESVGGDAFDFVSYPDSQLGPVLDVARTTVRRPR